MRHQTITDNETDDKLVTPPLSLCLDLSPSALSTCFVSWACHRVGGRGSSVGRARDSWSGGPGFDPRCGRPLPTDWVGVSIM